MLYSTVRSCAVIAVGICIAASLSAQSPTACTPPVLLKYQGEGFFSYGSSINTFSSTNRGSHTVGQIVQGDNFSGDYSMLNGFWSRFLAPPLAPFVTVSQGEVQDRIQLTWEPDPLGAPASGGFKVYRDGIFLELVDANTFSYNDFNVIAGRAYVYTVVGVNNYGDGFPGEGIGFMVPDGVVTGVVETVSGSPVPDALITLSPRQGYSLFLGAMDGAVAPLDSNKSYLPYDGSDWTVSYWMKTSSAQEGDTILELRGYPLVMRAMSNNVQTGVRVYLGGTELISAPFNTDPAGWHHIAVVYSEGTGRLYVDGVLAGQNAFNSVSPATDLCLGNGAANGTGWSGWLDELRFYSRRLDEVDLDGVMTGTASRTTPGLLYYWKMDEQLGDKSFDVMNRFNRLYLCGAVFSSDRPTVSVSAITNDEGAYTIESVSYGTGITFTAKPNKNFYAHRSLKFIRSGSMNDYAELPDFPLPEKSTLELWVNSGGPNGAQCVLSKVWDNNDFRVMLYQNMSNTAESELRLYLNGTEQMVAMLPTGYRHLAFTIDSVGDSRVIDTYLDGTLKATNTFSNISGNFSADNTRWVLGARVDGGSYTDFYDGYIDEIAVYEGLLPADSIARHALFQRDMQGRGLRVYYPLDEGRGNRLNNSGSFLLGFGTTYGTEWSTFTQFQETDPHVFTPGFRQVTLNPSVTSVDKIDFIDRSTVPVSGFVRYKNTDCFVEKVEILVNGESYKPAVYSDSTGKFTIDIDPGSTVVLTPKYENHVFTPASWELIDVTTPVAGILFNDITTRKVSGVVAGGKCKKAIIQNPGTAQGTVCIVKVSSADGCFAKQIEIDNELGMYEFPALPPLENMIVAVTEHSDPVIKAAFQTLGGSQVNLTNSDTLIDFIYFAPPEVKIVSGLDYRSLDCQEVVLSQGNTVTIGVQMVENYYGGVCELDTADFRIINLFAGEVKDTALSTSTANKTLKYKFKVGSPVPTPPFKQILQIIGTTPDQRTASTVREGIITGVYVKENTFTSLLPKTPSVILRDPPGDGSYSYLEKGSSVCKTYTTHFDYEVGGGGGLEIHLGGNTEVAVGIPVATINNAGPIFDIGAEFQVTYQKITDNSFQTCTNIDSRISTSDQDLIVGGFQGGDIYMGEAFNLVFGFAEKVTFNDTTCSGQVKTVLNVQPDTFATAFMFSEWYLKTQVMRYLDSLAMNSSVPEKDRTEYQKSRTMWNDIIVKNEKLKEMAKKKRNISFDAGVVYEYSETNDTLKTDGDEYNVNSEESLETHFGFEFNKFGVVGMLKFVSNTSKGTRNENGKENTLTTGYVLADDDPGDGFTFDVAMDTVYRTPVFRLKAGQSSCPWEKGTAHREGTTLEFRDGSGPVADNIPPNEPAVFKFNLGNKSQTNEMRTYPFTAGPESNPDGAVIKLNGAPLDQANYYAIPFGEEVPVLITVERGPEEYNYDSLEIVLYSDCEDARAGALGILPDDDKVVYSAQYVSAHFIRPCSEVDINVPLQDWVIFPDPLTSGPDDVMRITVSGYDTTNTDFSLVRVQYRRTDGDGAWINITPLSDRYNPNWYGIGSVSAPELLQPGFTQFYWNTTGLADGPYEVRAVAVCTGNSADKPGYSAVIKGRIEREPPSLVGVPQPSDGVYNVGDEISFTFNKPVNCNKLIPADITQPNNVGLYDATTGKLIDIDVTCYENKIILDPNFDNKFFENKIIRAELHSIEDLIGNESTYLEWEFYVDRNELAWLTDSIGMTKSLEETRTVTAAIHNRGGYPVPFTITDLPDWVHVVPNQGTLAPNEIRQISFTVDSTLAFGMWKDSITLHTETGQNPFFMGGDERLPLGVRVICRPPAWDINAGLYENSMNMVLKLNVQGQISVDPEDIVGAFINGELRGRAHVQYAPQVSTPSNKVYLAYLTIYGDINDVMDTVKLQIWDASECLLYGTVAEQFVFTPDVIVGFPDNPQVVSTNNLLLREIPLGFGWNWVSFNLDFPNNSLNSALSSLANPGNDLIKSQTQFATYGGAWYGSLLGLDSKKMYLYRADQPDTLQMLGMMIDPATVSLPLSQGWNWIGYVPYYSLPINQALKSLKDSGVLTHGDIVKSQTAFAQYISSIAYTGWVGNLEYLMPPKGYQIKLSRPGGGTLIYPPQSFTDAPVESRNGKDRPLGFWTVNPALYESSATLIGMLKVNGQNATTSTMELGAFVGDQVRGSAQAIYVEPLGAYLFFMTYYSNTPGELVRFKLYDAATGLVYQLNETGYFLSDNHQGSLDAPAPFTMTSVTGVEESPSADVSFDVVPNPFSRQTTFEYFIGKAEDVQFVITDLNGREVSRLKVPAIQGRNTVVWSGYNDEGTALQTGVYFVRLVTSDGIVTQKVMLQR